MSTPWPTGGRGVVEAVNRKRGIIAVLTDGGYTIIELMGHEAEVHDEVSWSDHLPHGGGRANNRTKGEVMDVYFQSHHVPLAKLLDRRYLFSPEKHPVVAAGRFRRGLAKLGVVRG